MPCHCQRYLFLVMIHTVKASTTMSGSVHHRWCCGIYCHTIWMHVRTCNCAASASKAPANWRDGLLTKRCVGGAAENGLTSLRVDSGVHVIGCITASWMPVLIRSSCAVAALRGLLGFLPGLLGLLRAKLDFLGLVLRGGLLLGAVAVPKKGSS